MEVDGHKLHYIDEGAGPVLLMLHGNPTWSIIWRGLIKQLRSSYRVIALDHLGCGLSDKPKNAAYTLSMHMKNLEGFIAQLSLSEITLFVHDWGGPIGFGHVVKHVDLYKKLFIFNTVAFEIKHLPLRIRLCALPIIGKLAIQGFNAFSYLGTYMSCVKPMPAIIRKAYLFPYNNFANRIANYEFVRDIPFNERHRSWNTLKDIENNLCVLRNLPKVIIWGMQDFCFTSYYLEQWQKIFPGIHVHKIEGAGHYLLEDEPDMIVQKVKEELNQAVEFS
ncbi:MAG: alpha/beta fold hydrolase [Candidatus Anammoxibacter sp.]